MVGAELGKGLSFEFPSGSPITLLLKFTSFSPTKSPDLSSGFILQGVQGALLLKNQKSLPFEIPAVSKYCLNHFIKMYRLAPFINMVGG